MGADVCPHGLCRDRYDYDCAECDERCCPTCDGMGYGKAKPIVWTRERPTVPGHHYWILPKGHQTPEVAWVDKNQRGELFASIAGEYLWWIGPERPSHADEANDALWAGPIYPPPLPEAPL